MEVFLKRLISIVSLFSTLCFAEININSPVVLNEKMTDVLTGEQFNLETFKGKTVVFEWFNQECPFVKKHYDLSKMHMQNLQKDATKNGIIWITINSSANDKEGFIKDKDMALTIKKNLNMNSSHLVLDHNGKIGKFFGAKVTPHMFIINKEGKLVYKGGIDSKKSTEASDIKAAGVSNYFTDALTAVMAGQNPKMAVTEEYGCGVKYAKN
jgi:hypothetical protein